MAIAHVALALGRFEVADVAQVNQVEDAVAMHDAFPTFLQGSNDLGEFIQALDFPFDGAQVRWLVYRLFQVG